jgi:hypothetical protein
VIGAIFAAYCRGRDDARSGRAPFVEVEPGFWRVDGERFYALGFRDEGRRMAEEGRLAQFGLPLFERSERRRAPRRRAHERAGLAPLTELDIPPAR